MFCWCYCWHEILWLLVEFGVGKELVVEKCGVLSCIATKFGFHVIFVFPLKCNCFIFILWFKRFLCVLFVFILWNKNVMTNKLWVKSHYEGAKNVVTLYYFIGVSIVWTSTMVILKHIFPKILRNMVDYNTNNSITIFFSNL